MRNKLRIVMLAAIVAVTMLVPAGVFAGTTAAATPDAIGTTGIKWQKSLGTGWSNAPTPPALMGGSIYVGAGDKVYKMNKDTGKQEAVSKSIGGTVGYAMMPVISDGNGYIYVSTAKCQIVKLKASDLSIVWKSAETFDGQNVCPVEYIDGRVYSGTWGDDNDGGTFFCIDGSTGKTIWKKFDSEGYYWAGAAKLGDRIIFGSDNQTLYSIGADAENTSGIKALSLKVSEKYSNNVRSTPAVSGNYAYFTTTSATVMSSSATEGKLYKVSLASDGTPEKVTDYDFGSSSCSPVISGDRIYVGGNKGKLSAFDTDLNQKWTTTTNGGEIKGDILVSTGTAGKVSIYSTGNNGVGGIYCVQADANGSKLTEGMTFVPQHRQYCISPVTAGDDGTLYYKNDSGYIMAVNGVSDSSAVSAKATSTGYQSVKVLWNNKANATAYTVYRSTDGKTFVKVSTIDVSKVNYDFGYNTTFYNEKGLTTNKAYYYKVTATLLDGSTTAAATASKVRPVPASAKVSTAAGSRKITVKWGKVTGAGGYCVYRATSKNGSYKKVKTMTGTKFVNTKLKKGRTYYYKVKAYRTVSGKKVFGGWSNISYKKVK